ncbi:hypothetical protein G3I29_14050, partial [Streptomyces halstedii]|nr:hypothetical protein [Streptomyces halstedii]
PVAAVVPSESPEVVAVVTPTGTAEGAGTEDGGPESVEDAAGRAGTVPGVPQGAGEQVAGARGATDVER